MKKLDIKEKPQVSYCISNELRDQQIEINTRLVEGRVEKSEELRKEPIAIVAFGPSLNDTWEKIKDFKYIMTCSGSHKFLIDRGIIPTWDINVDPREHKIKLMGQPHKDIEYLLASTVHPKLVKHLQGYNVKLWHVFATEEESLRVLPREEWAITGGSSIGSRALTLARFMGFTELHVFGMDGNFRGKQSHASEHPNTPGQMFETEYNGKIYYTTPSLLHCAKEVENEINQMPDVNATFYGEGLTQEIMKSYKRSPIKKESIIAYSKPGLISKEYMELNKQLHDDVPNYGMGGSKHKDVVLALAKSLSTTSVLDYGCGKGLLGRSLDFPIYEYDPAIPGKDSSPRPSELVVCTDVLEHIEPDKLNFVLDDLKRCVKQVGYFVIATRQAIKTYSNGKNTHLIVENKEWWNKKLSKFFKVAQIFESPGEIKVVVAPKIKGEIEGQEVSTVEGKGIKASFYTPNDTTKWRAKTLFTKEPVTIDWIDSMTLNDVLYDIGANVGSYSVYAGIKGMNVYSFEPGSENYALLVRNLKLNNIKPQAYCMALTDIPKAGILYESSEEAGSACHTFNQEVDHSLQPRTSSISQGCLGIPMDDMVDMYGLPTPQHLKIDVDGLEHLVIKGASKILKTVKSLLIEINPSLEEHQKMIDYLISSGFVYDEVQVENSTRKEGAFKGCAEYVFRRTVKTPSNISLNYTLDKIKNSELLLYPFPHLLIENVFPEETYKQMIKHLPTNYQEIEKTRGTRGYPKRFTAGLQGYLWDDIKKFLLGRELKNVLCEKFEVGIKNLIEDTLLIRDYEGYQITPHTDTPKKVITALFYLPVDDKNKNAGTTLYMPKKDGFVCKTGKHYSFEEFDPIITAPFKPNSVLIFARTDYSFHGVEPSNVIRDVLLYNINQQK